MISPAESALLAKLVAGAPPSEIDLDSLSARFRAVADLVTGANGAGRLVALEQALGDAPDAAEVIETIFRAAADGTVSEERGVPAKVFTLLTPAQVKSLQPPEPLVKGLLFRNTLAAFVGSYGTFKSFAALDLVLSVATGTPFLSRDVEHGMAVYICSEGIHAVKLRMLAWEQERGLEAPEKTCRLLGDPPQLLEPREGPSDVDALMDAIRKLDDVPVLVVFDTLARSIVGADENAGRDMGRVVVAADRIRRATGALVLLIHHVDKMRGQIRGHTALPGALDTIVTFTRDSSEQVQIGCEKQKDAAEFDPFTVRRRVVTLDTLHTSVVLELADAETSEQLTTAEQKVLDVLDDTFGPEGASASRWQKIAEEENLSPRTFYRAKKKLLETKRVVTDGKSRAHFWPADKAPLDLLAAITATEAADPTPPASVNDDEGVPF